MRKPGLVAVVLLLMALLAAACNGAIDEPEEPGAAPEPPADEETEAPEGEDPAEETEAPEGGDPADAADAESFFSEPIDLDPHQAMTGPAGEPVVDASEVEPLTEEEIAEIREGGYTAALLWGGEGPWWDHLTAGAEAGLEELGIEVVAQTAAQYDPAIQADDVENVMSLNPDIILSLPVDPTSAAQAFRPAVDAGVTLVFVDNAAQGYEAGNEYVTVVSGDHFAMGRITAELMAEAIGGDGQVGWIYHDADFFITNNRDNTFRAMMEQEYEDIVIVDAKGFTSEPEAGPATVAMIQQHPGIEGIYVSWDVVAEYVLEELRAAGRDDIWVVTHDLGLANDIAMAEGEMMYGKAIDSPYNEGEMLATLAAYGLLDKEAPPFVVAQPLEVTGENLAEAYEYGTGGPPPPELQEALDG